MGAATPDRTLALYLAGVVVQRCHTDQAGHAASVELAQFRQLDQQHRHAGRTDAQHAGQRSGEFGVMALYVDRHIDLGIIEFGLEELEHAVDARSGCNV